MPGMPAIPTNMPRMGPPRPPPQQSTPEISEIRNEEAPPKIVETSTSTTKSKKAASTFSVEKQGDTLNYNELRDDDEP